MKCNIAFEFYCVTYCHCSYKLWGIYDPYHHLNELQKHKMQQQIVNIQKALLKI